MVYGQRMKGNRDVNCGDEKCENREHKIYQRQGKEDCVNDDIPPEIKGRYSSKRMKGWTKTEWFKIIVGTVFNITLTNSSSQPWPLLVSHKSTIMIKYATAIIAIQQTIDSEKDGRLSKEEDNR